MSKLIATEHPFSLYLGKFGTYFVRLTSVDYHSTQGFELSSEEVLGLLADGEAAKNLLKTINKRSSGYPNEKA